MDHLIGEILCVLICIIRKQNLEGMRVADVRVGIRDMKFRLIKYCKCRLGVTTRLFDCDGGGGLKKILTLTPTKELSEAL